MTRHYRRKRDYRNVKPWQDEEYLGDHIGLYPAMGNLFGYQYQPTFADPDLICRAIPAEGSVIRYSAFTEKAPQAWGWCKKDLLPGKQQISTKGKLFNAILTFIQEVVK